MRLHSSNCFMGSTAAAALLLLLCLGRVQAEDGTVAAAGVGSCSSKCSQNLLIIVGPFSKDKKDKALKEFCDGSSCSKCIGYALACGCKDKPPYSLSGTNASWRECWVTPVNGTCSAPCKDNQYKGPDYTSQCLYNTTSNSTYWSVPAGGPCVRYCRGSPADYAGTRAAANGAANKIFWPPNPKKTAYTWLRNCTSLLVNQTCTGNATCVPGGATTTATATCSDTGSSAKWVVTDQCRPATCAALPTTPNATFSANCTNAYLNLRCNATCDASFTGNPTPTAVCASSGWAVSGVCVGPASLTLALVGSSSPVVSGQTITIKATMSQTNGNVSSRPVTLTVTPTNTAVTCPSLTATTDATGVAQFTCTIGEANLQPGSFVAAATASPAVGSSVTAPNLTVTTQGALCGSLNGTSTTLFSQNFEANADSMIGAFTRIGPGTTAFQGSYYAAVNTAASTTTTFTRWGNADGTAQNPTSFPASGKLVTQVAVYLDPNAAVYTTSGQTFDFTVALNKAGTPAAHSRDYIFSIGWYDAANSGLTPQANTFWASASNNSPGNPKDPARNPTPITQAGWYYMQHVFLPKPCDYNAAVQCIYAQLKLFKAYQGASCGDVVTTVSGGSASWELGPRTKDSVNGVSDEVADTGGARYGWFIEPPAVPWQADINVDAFTYLSF